MCEPSPAPTPRAGQHSLRGVPKERETHAQQQVAAPGQLLSWPLDTVLCCHNVTPSWPPPLTATLGPCEPPRASRGAQGPSREGRGRRPRDEDGCASTRCPPLTWKRLRQKPGVPQRLGHGLSTAQARRPSAGTGTKAPSHTGQRLLAERHSHSARSPGRKGAGWRAGTPSGTGTSLSAASGTPRGRPAAEEGERLDARGRPGGARAAPLRDPQLLPPAPPGTRHPAWALAAAPSLTAAVWSGHRLRGHAPHPTAPRWSPYIPPRQGPAAGPWCAPHPLCAAHAHC